jgi:RNA polymerase sigma-70 factor, ECF subfamily
MSEQIDEDKLVVSAIANAKRGDPDSFVWLIEQYLPFLSSTIGRLVPQDAIEDVAQEVLIRAYQSIPNYQPKAQFRWWLRTIAVRASLDYWRIERRIERNAREFEEHSSNGEPNSQSEAALLDLERFLSRLCPEDRMLVTLVFLEDRSHKEVAKLLGISLAAVKVRCFRLRKKIRSSFMI